MRGYSSQQAPQRQPPALARRSGCCEKSTVGLAVVGLVGQQRVDAGLELGGDAAEGQAGHRLRRAGRRPRPGAADPTAATAPSADPPGPAGRRRPGPIGARAPSARPRAVGAGRPDGCASDVPSASLGLGQDLGVERAWSRAARRGCRRPRSGPPSSSTTRSARLMVDSRWATISVVRPSMSTRSASWICCSTWTSMALVASSRTRMGGLTSRVRAMAMRWRWPPDRV